MPDLVELRLEDESSHRPLESGELQFKVEQPDGDAVALCCRFSVSNKTDKAVAYQILATKAAVPAYTVRGRIGTLPKGGSKLVEIVFNDSAMEMNVDGKDRFRVLAVELEKSATAEDRWQQVQSMDTSALKTTQQTIKLKAGADPRGALDTDPAPEPEQDEPTEDGCDAAKGSGDEKAAWIFARNKGFHVDTTQEGDGCTFPIQGDRVLLHYTGTLREGGTEFDSSRKRGSPFELVIGEGKAIKGWDEGLRTMAEGERAILRVSAAFGYKDKGTDKVPPNADLAFDIEVLCVSKPPTTAQLKAMNGAERERIITRFYAKHEPSKTPTQIKGILAKPAYASDFSKLVKALAKKYSESPATLSWQEQKLVAKQRTTGSQQRKQEQKKAPPKPAEKPSFFNSATASSFSIPAASKPVFGMPAAGKPGLFGSFGSGGSAATAVTTATAAAAPPAFSFSAKVDFAGGSNGSSSASTVAASGGAVFGQAATLGFGKASAGGQVAAGSAAAAAPPSFSSPPSTSSPFVTPAVAKEPTTTAEQRKAFEIFYAKHCPADKEAGAQVATAVRLTEQKGFGVVCTTLEKKYGEDPVAMWRAAGSTGGGAGNGGGANANAISAVAKQDHKRSIKMEDMSVEMVGNWLDSIGCNNSVIERFERELIDGDALLSLDEDALRGEILLIEDGFSGSQVSQVLEAMAALEKDGWLASSAGSGPAAAPAPAKPFAFSLSNASAPAPTAAAPAPTLSIFGNKPSSAGFSFAKPATPSTKVATGAPVVQIGDMSIDMVCEWLISIGIADTLGTTRAAFRAQHIDGEALQELDDATMRDEIGTMSAADRALVLQERPGLSKNGWTASASSTGSNSPSSAQPFKPASLSGSALGNSSSSSSKPAFLFGGNASGSSFSFSSPAKNATSSAEAAVTPPTASSSGAASSNGGFSFKPQTFTSPTQSTGPEKPVASKFSFTSPTSTAAGTTGSGFSFTPLKPASAGASAQSCPPVASAVGSNTGVSGRTGSMTHMSIEETCKWVEGLLEPPPGGLSSAQRSQLDMVQNAFRKHQVDGEILTDLSEDNLINDIGIPKVAAMVILTAIRQQQTAASTAPEPEPEAAAGGMSPPPSCFPAPVSDGHCFLSADGTGIVVAHMLELGDGCASLCVDGEASAIIAVSESGHGVASFSFESGSLCGDGRPKTQVELDRDRVQQEAAALRAKLAAKGSGRPSISSNGDNGSSPPFSFGGHVASSGPVSGSAVGTSAGEAGTGTGVDPKHAAAFFSAPENRAFARTSAAARVASGQAGFGTVQGGDVFVAPDGSGVVTLRLAMAGGVGGTSRQGRARAHIVLSSPGGCGIATMVFSGSDGYALKILAPGAVSAPPSIPAAIVSSAADGDDGDLEVLSVETADGEIKLESLLSNLMDSLHADPSSVLENPAANWQPIPSALTEAFAAANADKTDSVAASSSPPAQQQPTSSASSSSGLFGAMAAIGISSPPQSSGGSFSFSGFGCGSPASTTASISASRPPQQASAASESSPAFSSSPGTSAFSAKVSPLPAVGLPPGVAQFGSPASSSASASSASPPSFAGGGAGGSSFGSFSFGGNGGSSKPAFSFSSQGAATPPDSAAAGGGAGTSPAFGTPALSFGGAGTPHSNGGGNGSTSGGSNFSMTGGVPKPAFSFAGTGSRSSSAFSGFGAAASPSPSSFSLPAAAPTTSFSSSFSFGAAKSGAAATPPALGGGTFSSPAPAASAPFSFGGSGTKPSFTFQNN